MRQSFARILPAVLCFSLVSTAGLFAHHGGDHPAWEIDEFDERTSFRDGITHPFTGLDHLVVMLAVGMIAFATRRWETAAVFGAAVGLGAATDSASPGWLLALTVVVLGSLLIGHLRTAFTAQVVLVAISGLVHGGAHGDVLHGFGAGAGLCLGTVAGVFSGVVLAHAWTPLPQAATRFAGASVVVVGIWPAMTALLPG